jgi:hypothetical protein
MGKFFVLAVALAIGYSLGYRDARANPDHVLHRAVQQVRTIFGAKPTNDIDAVMTKVEGKD